MYRHNIYKHNETEIFPQSELIDIFTRMASQRYII